jgi:predicted Zn-ribbon and HTH transcriptional regulator
MKNIFKGLLKRKGQKAEKVDIKCKECGMQFQSKDSLEVHKRKAHSGRGEGKKKE